jgi:SAM-dependent methyltransferase
MGTEREGMLEVDFDQFSHSYSEELRSSTGPLGKSDDFFASVKLHCLKAWVVPPAGNWDILDFGCGIGVLSGLVAKTFPDSQVDGYDISQKCLCVGRKKNAGFKNIRFINNLAPGPRYDLIIAANVFHHITASDRTQTFQFMKQRLKLGGRIAVFEHNPLNPLTRHVVRICPFDTDAKLIGKQELSRIAETSGFDTVMSNYILFFPWKSELLRRLEGLLALLPLGAQYMLLLRRRE